MTFNQLCHKISRKTEAEWRAHFKECKDSTRSWVQAHGELAALLGFVGGMLMVVFYRIFAWIFFLLAIVAGIVWLRLPDSEGDSCSGEDK